MNIQDRTKSNDNMKASIKLVTIAYYSFSIN